LWRFQTTFAVIVYHLAKSAPDVSWFSVWVWFQMRRKARFFR
jgi:hypothetical protein